MFWRSAMCGFKSPGSTRPSLLVPPSPVGRWPVGMKNIASLPRIDSTPSILDTLSCIAVSYANFVVSRSCNSISFSGSGAFRVPATNSSALSTSLWTCATNKRRISSLSMSFVSHFVSSCFYRRWVHCKDVDSAGFKKQHILPPHP